MSDSPNRKTVRRPTRSIRRKVLSLVVLSAVVPTALVGLSSYWTARATLTEKLSEQLNARASLTASRVGEWYQERRHDARVFAGSTMVLGRLQGRGVDDGQSRAYLEEVQGRYGSYGTLAVVDHQGRTVASVGEADDGLARAVARPLGSSAAIEVAEGGRPTLWITSPILGEDGAFLGRFVMSCDFESLRDSISDGDLGVDERLRLSTEADVLFTHPVGTEDEVDFPRDLPAMGSITETRDGRGVPVLAAARAVAISDLKETLTLTVATNADDAFAAVTELRHRVILLSGVVVLIAVVLGYALVSSLTDPLEHLAIRARAVAHGDYTSDLPVLSRDEIGYLTEVFNGMMANLKASHERLERLSITDELTQLVNRRELRRVLESEIVRSQRTKRPLSVVMLDLDRFKAYNDEHGHLRGDELLARLGVYLRSVLSPGALAARYGGEEFLVLLPGRTLEEAARFAQDVRTGFPEAESAEAGTPEVKVTLSLGVAALGPGHETPAKLIDAADQALYEAKRSGRDRVVTAGSAAASEAARPEARDTRTKSKSKSKSKAKAKKSGSKAKAGPDGEPDEENEDKAPSDAALVS